MPSKNLQKNSSLSIQADPSLNEDMQENSELKEEPVSLSSDTSTDGGLFGAKKSVAFSATRGKKKSNNQYSSASIYTAITTGENVTSTDADDSTIENNMSITIDPDEYNSDDYNVQSSKEELTIQSLTGISKYMQDSSINRLRPELIASLDWLPIKNDKGYNTPVNDLIDFRWHLNKVMIDNVHDTMELFKSEDPSGTYTTLKNNYDSAVNEKSKELLSAIFEFMLILDASKLSLDIKDNSEKIESLMSKIYTGKLNPVGFDISDPTLKSMFTNTLRFSEDSYSLFSNTKIISQVIYDLLYACKFHSPLLISTTNFDRVNDTDALLINKNIVPSNKSFRFNPQTVGNAGSFKFDATRYQDYSSFLSSLPFSDVDKLKVITMAISRELSVSSGLGRLKKISSSIIKRYDLDSDVSTVLDNIFGIPVDTILDLPTPSGSLLDYTNVNVAGIDESVLPFETRVITDGSNRTTIPGSIALVDSINKFDNSNFDVSKFTSFAKGFNDSVIDSTNAVENILNLKNKRNDLEPDAIFKNMLSKFLPSFDELKTSQVKNQEQAIIAALFSQSKIDPTLRHMLFRYLLEVRDILDDIRSDSTNPPESELINSAAQASSRKRGRPIRLSSIGSFTTYKSSLTSSSFSKNLNVSKRIANNLFSNMVDPISTTSMKIAMHVKNNASATAQNNSSPILLSRSAVYSTLQSSFRQSSPSGNVFVSIVELCRELEQSLNYVDENSGSFLNNEGLTLINNWDENVLLMLLFELFVISFSNFSNTKFVNIDNQKSNSGLYVNVDYESIQSNYSKIKAIFDDEQDITDLDSQTPDGIYNTVLVSLRQEKSFINKSFSFLQALGLTIKNSSDQLTSFFDASAKNSSARKDLEIINTAQGKRFLSDMTYQQFVLTNIAMSKLLPRENAGTYLPSTKSCTESELKALKAFASTPSLSGRVGDNIRVLSVGLPSELTSALYNPPYTLGSNQEVEIAGSKNIVEVMVYKRDLEFEDLIFKPKKFLFDTSLFLLPDAYDKNDSYKSFSDIVSKCTFTSIPNVKKKDVYLQAFNANEILQTGRYQDLGTDVGSTILSNHVSDNMLKKYYKILFGMEFDEHSFLFHDVWSDLIVDNTTANIIKVLEANDKLKHWVRNGKIPVTTLFKEITIDGIKRQRVLSAGDNAVWRYIQPRTTVSRLIARPISRLSRRKVVTLRSVLRSPSLRKKRSMISAKMIAANTRFATTTFSTMGANPTNNYSKLFRFGKKVGLQKFYKRAYSKNKTIGNRLAFKYLGLRRIKRFRGRLTRTYSVSRHMTPEEINSFRMLCSSCLFTKETLLQRSLSPKLFERVFLLPVDPDDFEIDMEATGESSAGKNFLNQKIFSNLTKDVNMPDGRVIKMLKPRRKNENYSSFNEFFVVVSTPGLQES